MRGRARALAALDVLTRNGHALAILLGCLPVLLGLVLNYQGVDAFRYPNKYGRSQTATPEMLYWLGGLVIAGASGSALLIRADRLNTEKLARRKEAKQLRRRIRRH